MANLCLINQTHGTVEKGVKIKSHILNLETGNILCGRNISGAYGADVDYDYLTIHTVRLLVKCICIKCLKKAFDTIEIELDED